MVTVVVVFAVALGCSAILTPLVRNAAVRSNLLDIAASSRKVHAQPIPRLGGIAIAAGFLVPIVGLLIFHPSGALFSLELKRTAGLLAGGLLIIALGLYDDLRGANARVKFAVQIVAASLTFALGYRIEALALPFVDGIPLGPFAYPFTVFWIVGVINAFNLLDGLDGLAGGTAFIAAGALFTIALAGHHPLVMVATAALAGAVLGFLFFNWNPASIFMGDTGSLFLGFVLATTAIRASATPSGAVDLLIPILVFGIPIGDTLLAMARRWLRGAPLFSADRGHIHHRLLAKGLSHRDTVLVAYGVSLCLGAAALVLARAEDLEGLAALVLVAAGSLALLHWLGYIQWARIGEVIETRRRNQRRRREVARIAGRLRNAAHPLGVWDTVVAATEPLVADRVVLRAGPHAFSAGIDEVRALHVARFNLHPDRPGRDFIELGWLGARQIDRDTELAVEFLCDNVRKALLRVDPAVAVHPALTAGAASNVVTLRKSA